MMHSDVGSGYFGHWKMEVYEGDLKYSSLPLSKRVANAYYATDKFVCRRPLRKVRHRGEILNKRTEVFEGDNLVTTSGKGLLLDMLYGLASKTKVTQMGVGTSATAAAVGDTTLTGQVLFVFDSLPTRSGLVVTAVATAGTAVANINWQELASFNNDPTMLNRIAPIGPFNKTSAVSIVVTQTLTQS